MSQPNVQRVIGQLVTDEACRHRFEQDPQATLQRLAESGLDLTPGEQQAIARIDPGLLSLFSNAIDPRLQRVEARGVAS